jgi:hypothetical protein
MAVKLTDMRRYAIDRRVEITIIDSISGRRCLINVRGQASIPGKDRSFKIEDVIDAAESFEVTSSGKPQLLNRDQIAAAMSDHFKSRGFNTASKQEE